MEASKRKENVEAAAAPAIPPKPATLSRASSADEQGPGLLRAALAAVDGDASLAGSAAGGGGGGGARTIHVRTLPVTGLRVIDPVVRRPGEFAGIKSDLDEFGFAVVGGVLTEAERTAFMDAFWAAASLRCPALDRNDPATWTPENTEWRGTYGAGQYKHYGMAQEAHVWIVRQNAVIRRVFEQAVFGGDECVVSLDGCAALFAPCVSKLKLHVDLVPGIAGHNFGSVQASYNLFPVQTNAEGKAGAGFVCVPGSHKGYADRWAARLAKSGFAKPKKHWFLIEDDSEMQQQAALVLSPANSLVLWKSETAHKNHGGDFTVADLGGRMCRLTQFVCWQRKADRTPAVRAKKIQIVKDGACGNHWAALGTRVAIKPFPPWGHHPIPVIVPDFGGGDDLPENIASIL